MKNKKTLMIDMDDVLVSGGMLRMVNEFLHSNYTYNDITNYYIDDIVPKDRIDEWWDFFVKGNMYEKEGLIDKYTYDVVLKLNEKYDLNIVTAYFAKMNKAPSMLGKHIQNKLDFLTTYLPFLSASQIQFVNNKSLIMTDIKIDDKLSNLSGNGQKILFEAYHNKDLTNEFLKENNIVKVTSWKEIADILL